MSPISNQPKGAAMPIEAVEVPVRSRVWTDQDAKQAYDLLSEGRAAKYGTYTPEEGESKARTQGMALDRLIKSRHGQRFGVSVWTDENGNFIGALLPRAPRERKPAKGKK